jgi:hypothetical protein
MWLWQFLGWQHLCWIANVQNTRTNHYSDHYNFSSNEISYLPSLTIITPIMRSPSCRSSCLPADPFRPWLCVSTDNKANGSHHLVITTHVCTVEVAFLLLLWKFCRSSCRAIWKCKKMGLICKEKPSTQCKSLYVEYSRDVTIL